MQKRTAAIVNIWAWTITAGLILSCDPDNQTDPQGIPGFETSPEVSQLQTGELDGASGIADARNFNNALWVHNDHDPNLYLLGRDGALVGKIAFAGGSRDWEDMAIGPGPVENTTYLYIAETGDNLGVHSEYYIHRFPEPVEGQVQVDNYETLPFTYSDGKQYDVETLLLDPFTKDLYLLTKALADQSLVFRLPYPQKHGESNIAEYVKTIPYGMLTSGDISPDGTEILLRNYTAIYYWKLREGETVISALDRRHDQQPPYTLEPQGEAIAFGRYGEGYFTLSEKGRSSLPVNLYFYRRKAPQESSARPE